MKPRPQRYSNRVIIEKCINQKGRCIYCNHNLIPGDKYRKPTVEHIIPVSQGGTSDSDNLAIACFKCNMYRGNIELDLFLDGYRCWCEHRQGENSVNVPKKFRGPKRWYHGNMIKW